MAAFNLYRANCIGNEWNCLYPHKVCAGDEESLRQAIRALTGLTEGNRLVGIISHVAELREKIDKQIVVTKDKTGGSRVEIVV